MKFSKWAVSILVIFTIATLTSCETSSDGGDKYAVQYIANGSTGGTAPANDAYEAGETATVLGNPGNLEKGNYAFSNWNTSTDGTGTNYGEGSTVVMGERPLVLYAQYGSSKGLVYTKIGTTSYSVAGNGANTGYITIPKDYMGLPVTEIAPNAFKNCSGLTGYSTPAGLVSIGANAFQGCTALTSTMISSAVLSVGDYAFQGCTSLTGISSISSGGITRTIGISAFEGCTALLKFGIGGNISSIGDNAFKGCTLLATIEFNSQTPPSLQTGSSVFDGISTEAMIIVPAAAYSTYTAAADWSSCSSIIVASNAVLIYTLIESTSYSVKGDWMNSGSLIIPSTHKGLPVTVIGDNAFSSSSITGISIPAGVTTIGKNAFSNSDLTSVTIPAGVATVGEYAFFNCFDLTSVTLQNGLTSIGAYAFDNCDGLTGIVIPASVSSIGNYAFSGSGLTSITMNSLTPPAVVGSNIFWAIPNGLVIHVNNSTAVTNYTAANWDDYGTLTTP